MPHQSIIIPVYNKWELTRGCLESLAKTSAGLDVEVIVVDNGSTDETPSGCEPLGRSLFGQGFRLMRFEKNRNFGPACNAGAEAASSSTLFFLNNDTLLTEGWLEPLQETLRQDPTLGAVGPLLLYPDGTVQHLGVVYYSWLGGIHLYQHLPGAHPLARRRRRLQAITGAAMLMDRSLFLSVGGFHPGYANGFEDLELCACLARRGLATSCVPESVIYHLESQSQGRFEHDDTNYKLFTSRCRDVVRPDFYEIGPAEGHEVRLSRDGFPYLALPKARSVELILRVSRAKNALEVADVLDEEPLWEEGYDLYATQLERLGLLQEALSIRRTQQTLFKEIECFWHMRRLVERLGKTELVGLLDEKLAEQAARTSDRDSTIDNILGRMAVLLKWGSPDAASLYFRFLEDWLKVAPAAGRPVGGSHPGPC